MIALFFDKSRCNINLQIIPFLKSAIEVLPSLEWVETPSQNTLTK